MGWVADLLRGGKDGQLLFSGDKGVVVLFPLPRSVGAISYGL